MPYPVEWPLDSEHMDKFCEMYAQNLRAGQTRGENREEVLARPIYQHLPLVRIINEPALKGTMANRGSCVLAFFFKSLEETDRQTDGARQVNRVAEMVRDLRLENFVVAGIDLSSTGGYIVKQVLSAIVR